MKYLEYSVKGETARVSSKFQGYLVEAVRNGHWTTLGTIAVVWPHKFQVYQSYTKTVSYPTLHGDLRTALEALVEACQVVVKDSMTVREKPIVVHGAPIEFPKPEK